MPRMRIVVSVGAALSTALLLVVGCGSDRDGDKAIPVTPPTSTRLINPPPPDPTTADGVAVIALTEIYRWHPTAELPGVSLLRARRWLGPHLRAVLEKPAIGVETPKPTLQWSDWAAKKAIIEAFAFASGEQAPVEEPSASAVAPSTGAAVSPGATAGPETDAGQVLRRTLCKIGIEQTVVYPDGRREELPPTTVIATVVLTPGGWLLDDFH